MRKRLPLILLALLVWFALIGVWLLYTPAVQLRIARLRTEIHYLLNPPDHVSLISDEMVAEVVQATLTALAHSPTPLPSATPTTPATQAATATLPVYTPTPTQTPSPSPTALPPVVRLSGIRHEWQSFNNCGPANVAMALSYWGWAGDQTVTKAALRPHPEDANVMPGEMVEYIQAGTGLRALIRTGGTVHLLKALTAAGFPVIVEWGHHPEGDWWMGHYVVVSGYDDNYGRLITQDSLVMADLPVPYEEIEERWWRDFNGVYLVTYPPEREAELLAVLGPDADPVENTLRTLAAAEAEIPHLAERDLFFALFNRGAGLLALGQSEEAAAAFDTAFAVYAGLEDKQRPWRVLWYRAEAYQAYYEAGRYQSTIDLTTAALSMLSKRGLEESHYWRGLAYAALGDTQRARADLELAVTLRPTYREAIDALARLGD